MGASWLVGLVLVAGGPAPEVANLRDLVPALTACFQAPEGSAGSQLTVRFSLDAQGRVLGKPMITFAQLRGDAAAKEAFVAAVLSSLARCTPLHFRGGMGGAIAGRPLSIRFVGTARTRSA